MCLIYLTVGATRLYMHTQAATRAATAVAAVPRTVDGGATIPQSERLCKVLPKVMETAIKGVRDLDEQVSRRFKLHATRPLERFHRKPGTVHEGLPRVFSNSDGVMMLMPERVKYVGICVSVNVDVGNRHIHHAGSKHYNGVHILLYRCGGVKSVLCWRR